MQRTSQTGRPGNGSDFLSAERGRRFAAPSAFTLIEILVVITLIGVMVGMIVVNFSSSLTLRRAEANAESVYGLLKFARLRAVSSQMDYRVVYREDGRTMWLEALVTAEDDSASWEKTNHYAAKDVMLSKGIGVALTEHMPIDVEQEDVDEPSDTENDWGIVFKPSGQSDHAKLNIGVGEDDDLKFGKTILVQGFTGMVELADGVNAEMKMVRRDLDLE